MGSPEIAPAFPAYRPSLVITKRPGVRAVALGFEDLRLRGKYRAHLLHRVDFDLADAFGGNAVFVCQFLQRGLVAVLEPAPRDDVARACVESGQALLQCV